MTRKYIKNTALSAFLSLSVALGGFFAVSNVTKVYALPSSHEVQISTLTNGNQGITGLCWAYACTKVLESYYYTNTYPHQTINISEDWISLAYMYYVNDPNQTLTSKDKQDYLWGTTGQPMYYQNVINAYGFVEEDDWQLTEAVTMQNYKTLFEESLQFAHKNIFSNLEFGWVGYQISGYNTTNFVNKIKTLLFGNEMVYSAIASKPILESNSSKYVYYEGVNTTDVGHAMTIVGYDDNITILASSKTFTGAFKILNSYGESNQYYYVPYAMFDSNLQSNDNATSKETNQILSNTYSVLNLNITPPTDSGEDDDGEDITPPTDENPDGTDPIIPPSDDEDPIIPPDEDPVAPPEDESPVVPPESDEDGPQTPNDETHETDSPNFIEIFNNKALSEKIVVGFGIGMTVVFLCTIIVLFVAMFLRKHSTASTNKNVLAKTFSDYQAHKFELQKQNQELEKQIQELREIQQRKKQRRLKRKFYENIDKKS